jgi:hypothetical protein
VAAHFTTWSLGEIATEFEAMARDAHASFGHLDTAQLNWRPDPASWSVAQCFDHLLRVNRAMSQAIETAMAGTGARSVWQRLPILPRLFGAMMIKSQMPDTRRKFIAPAKAAPMPAATAIDAEIVKRFIASQHDAAGRVRQLDEPHAARTIAVSPFVAFVTYSALDGYRLIATHQRRHFEQARRVTEAPGFPQ